MPSKLLLGFATCAWLTPSVALATYSIAAVDMSTQEVGGAITSCVGSLDVGIVYGALPGVGVIHAQAQLDQRGRAKARALELMMQGKAPKDIVAEITDPSFDPQYASRQYGLVDIMGRSAGFTGAQAQAYKRDQQGMSGPFAYSVQGNILTSQAVLDQATDAFEAPACDLAERLMRALEAGADHGEGDSRCTGDGIPSDSAYIQVDRPGQSEPYLRLSVADTGPESPLPMLRKQFDAWRKQHPCPMPSGMQAGSAAMSGTGGDSAAGSSGGAGGAAARGGATGNSGAVGSAGSTGTGAVGSAGSTGTGAVGSAGASASGAVGSAGSMGSVAVGSAGVTGSNGAVGSAGATSNPTAAAGSGRAGSGGAPTHGSAGDGAAGSAITRATAANSISTSPSEEPARTSSGCSLTARTSRLPAYWLLAPAALWLARRTTRRAADGSRRRRRIDEDPARVAGAPSRSRSLTLRDPRSEPFGSL